MIKQIVDTICKASWQIDDDLIVVSDCRVDNEDIECLKYLRENNCFEDFLDLEAINEGDVINFSLKLAELSSIGFFEHKESFIRRNKYSLVKPEYYILELRSFQDDDHKFIASYGLIITLIDVIKANSRHEFTDSDYDYSIIAKGDVSIVIPYNYGVEDVELSTEQIVALRDFLVILDGESEKQHFYLNELLEFIEKNTESERFRTIIHNIVELRANSEAAYLFYLSDFSSQKLKIEINTKLLEYSQKAQAIINDAQTKLIAIPVATVFAVSSLDTLMLLSVKNIAVLVSLLVFAFLLHIFIRNQQSGLKFITQNVSDYENGLRETNTLILHSEFRELNSGLKKQKGRLCLINCINWAIPSVIIFVWLILIASKCAIFKLLIILLR